VSSNGGKSGSSLGFDPLGALSVGTSGDSSVEGVNGASSGVVPGVVAAGACLAGVGICSAAGRATVGVASFGQRRQVVGV